MTIYAYVNQDQLAVYLPDTSLDWQGTWNALTTYPAGMAVTYGGRSWVALAPSTGVVPGGSTSSWAQLVVARTSPQTRVDGLWIKCEDGLYRQLVGLNVDGNTTLTLGDNAQT